MTASAKRTTRIDKREDLDKDATGGSRDKDHNDKEDNPRDDDIGVDDYDGNQNDGHRKDDR
jgi:hypothetical protein